MNPLPDKSENITRKYTIRSTIYIMLAAFITYCCMYAFRKPFTAATFDGLTIWGIDMKIMLISSQVIGYMLSKFIGIYFVSSMSPSNRIKNILILLGISWIALLAFAILPVRLTWLFMFINGLPLGMIWGLVFSFLEGRRNTELLGAGMSASFIVSSGLVKYAGKTLIEHFSVSEIWMPFITASFFIPFLFLGTYMLSKISPPDKEDIENRSERLPMNGLDKLRFVKTFTFGIIWIVIIYIALSIYRDLRDNFAVEIWEQLGFAGNTTILLTAEIPISIAVLIITAFMVLIRNNSTAFYSTLVIIAGGGIVLVSMTILFVNKLISPAFWMIITGFGLYLSYVSYHTMLFERWIAIFRLKSNIGFLMYLADSFGYLGSVIVLFGKNFLQVEINWLSFIVNIAYVAGILIILLSVISILYFRRKERSLNSEKLKVTALIPAIS